MEINIKSSSNGYKSQQRIVIVEKIERTTAKSPILKRFSLDPKGEII